MKNVKLSKKRKKLFKEGKIKSWNKGIKTGKQSEETKAKRSKSLKERWKDKKSGLNSKERNIKISKNNKGISRNKGKHTSPKTEFKKGHISHYKGKKRAEKSIKKQLATVKKNKDSGKYEETKKKISLALKGKNIGENGSNWKGGISGLDKIIRSRFEYKEWVSNCMTRDNWICQTCNKRGGQLHVHHIKPFALIIKSHKIKKVEEALKCKELWDLHNGITLCIECHKHTESYLKRYNKKGG